MLYTICLLGAWLIWHLFYRFRVVGRKNLPRGGYVMVCNHVAATDIVYLVLARIAWPKAIILAKQELFHITPILTWYIRRMGAVPVSRGRGDSAVIEQTVEKARAGRDVLIFPEGTRSKTGELGPLKSGAFLIAAKANVPVVPCRVLYQDGRPRFWRRVTLAIGQPLTPQQLGLSGEWEHMPPASALRGAKARCAQEMERLRRENAARTRCEKAEASKAPD